ncbi:unnamed protein product [Trichogramma brassicae]|uniref:Uncharacterized protein n=1 Tax=Trichogramma brassicae TaxID=86971 RepID=A0A6H5IGI6_9HYME|nr:unnamed protein product [Trichogramma brassicae]
MAEKQSSPSTDEKRGHEDEAVATDAGLESKDDQPIPPVAATEAADDPSSAIEQKKSDDNGNDEKEDDGRRSVEVNSKPTSPVDMIDKSAALEDKSDHVDGITESEVASSPTEIALESNDSSCKNVSADKSDKIESVAGPDGATPTQDTTTDQKNSPSEQITTAVEQQQKQQQQQQPVVDKVNKTGACAASPQEEKKELAPSSEKSTLPTAADETQPLLPERVARWVEKAATSKEAVVLSENKDGSGIEDDNKAIALDHDDESEARLQIDEKDEEEPCEITKRRHSSGTSASSDSQKSQKAATHIIRRSIRCTGPANIRKLREESRAEPSAAAWRRQYHQLYTVHSTLSMYRERDAKSLHRRNADLSSPPSRFIYCVRGYGKKPIDAMCSYVEACMTLYRLKHGRNCTTNYVTEYSFLFLLPVSSRSGALLGARSTPHRTPGQSPDSPPTPVAAAGGAPRTREWHDDDRVDKPCFLPRSSSVCLCLCWPRARVLFSPIRQVSGACSPPILCKPSLPYKLLAARCRSARWLRAATRTGAPGAGASATTASPRSRRCASDGFAPAAGRPSPTATYPSTYRRPGSARCTSPTTATRRTWSTWCWACRCARACAAAPYRRSACPSTFSPSPRCSSRTPSVRSSSRPRPTRARPTTTSSSTPKSLSSSRLKSRSD